MKNLINLLESQVSESNNTGTLVSDQRERNHRYWSLQPLGNEREGRSHYIDPRVFSAVEDKKAVFSETFLGSRQVVRFNGANQDESMAKTAYAMKVLKANYYETLFADGWHDAFVAKRMTVWVDWKRNREEITLRFLGQPSHVVNQRLTQLGEITNLDRSELQSYPIPSIGAQQFVHTGTLTVEVDRSYIDLDLVQPEFVLRDPEQAYSWDAAWNTQRIDITRLDLIDWGFDREQVEKLIPDSRWETRQEDNARRQHDGSQYRVVAGGQLSDNQEEVTIFKTRTWLMPEDFEHTPELVGFTPKPGANIYEIYWSGKEILRWNDGMPAIKVLDEMAVYEWAEYKVAHADGGLCTADVEAHQQKYGSGLKRGVMDNMNITNNPRWEVNAGALENYRDLLDNVIGGVVETADNMPPGQVRALDQPQLSPIVMGVMQMLDRDSEKRSGMSDLSRGLNQAAISNQNAENMVDKLSAKGERRVAMSARDWANNFFARLMQCIVRFGMKYDKSQSVMESGGRQIVIAPSTWSHDEDMEIEVALTPAEADQMSQRLMLMDSKLNADEDMRPLYGLKQKHALWDTVYELMGVKDSTRFLASPESPEVQQAMQRRAQMMEQQQMKQDQIIASEMNMKREQMDLYWANANSQIMDRLEDNELDRDKFMQDTHFKQEELEIEREQKRAVAV